MGKAVCNTDDQQKINMQIIIKTFLKSIDEKTEMEGGIMMEWGDPELPSRHEHMKATTTYRATLAESNLKTSRRALLQPRM